MRLLKILVVLAISLFVSGVYAAEFRNLRWEQAISKDLAGWDIHYSHTPGPPYEPLVSIQYSGNPQQSYTKQIELPEVVGGSAKYYFVVSARDTTGNVSGFSNEAELILTDTTPPAVPVKVMFEIVNPQ